MIKATNITKYFGDKTRVKVLDNLSFEIGKGELVALTGKSGSGKSTLLYVLSTMDTSYEGRLSMAGEEVTGWASDRLSLLRNQKIGFVFQFHYLLSDFTVLQNIMFPGMKAGTLSSKALEEKAYEKMKLLEIESLAHKPSQKLSGGQQQRVAIARALVNEPEILMADEPTGNLDSYNSGLVLEVFKKLSEEEHKTILVVTHDNDIAKATNRIIEIKDGKII